jgi:hypothetical protein
LTPVVGTSDTPHGKSAAIPEANCTRLRDGKVGQQKARTCILSGDDSVLPQKIARKAAPRRTLTTLRKAIPEVCLSIVPALSEGVNNQCQAAREIRTGAPGGIRTPDRRIRNAAGGEKRGLAQDVAEPSFTTYAIASYGVTPEICVTARDA